MVAPIYWRRHVVSSNTIGVGEAEARQKFHNALRLRLFLKTSPIKLAAACRKGSKEFYRETTRSNFK
jgi:hypothetical protein